MSAGEAFVEMVSFAGKFAVPVDESLSAGATATLDARLEALGRPSNDETLRNALA